MNDKRPTDFLDCDAMDFGDVLLLHADSVRSRRRHRTGITGKNSSSFIIPPEETGWRIPTQRDHTANWARP